MKIYITCGVSFNEKQKWFCVSKFWQIQHTHYLSISKTNKTNEFLNVLFQVSEWMEFEFILVIDDPI